MKPKILVADDEPSVQRMLTRSLGAETYDFLLASNGKDASEMIDAQEPDLVLLDIGMPQKNGWEVLRELRSNSQTSTIPVIMLTGYGSISNKVEGLELGADDYITKPFSIDELRARVASVLARNRLGVSANPLTKLPGSPIIEEETSRRIRERTPFAFFYVDINNFKSYNDAYGFAAGDRVIRETAALLRDSLRSQASEEWFLGHIGGDDFAFITDPACAPYVAQDIVSEFDRRAPGFYNAADRARGCIAAENRQGVRQSFPLITLSIGIVSSEQRILEHYAKVVELASEMKAYCKGWPNHRLSRFAFDRRSDDAPGRA